ncbi:hypothetical protein PR003_g21649 [Phytophthora rubi]|uniref:Uncharacterized protein n=1 Tax=Phytophthora rubi TaxID=129364 RepID=A0A6A4DCC3_9STRA|nr:hypothetical protein PR002_g14883 [Phytophthora rubi]KAE9304862.1 hypothetical protein PR003_g21649 [Phytophthora rubi]
MFAAQSADGALKDGLQHIGTKERKSDKEIAVETRKHRRVGAAEGAAGPRLLSAVSNRRKSSGPFQPFGGGVKI